MNWIYLGLLVIFMGSIVLIPPVLFIRFYIRRRRIIRNSIHQMAERLEEKTSEQEENERVA